MKIVNLGESNSVLNRFVAELRDVNIQKDSMRFRRNIERIGEIMAYEISKDFTYSKKVTWIMRKMHLFPLTGNTRTV